MLVMPLTYSNVRELSYFVYIVKNMDLWYNVFKKSLCLCDWTQMDF